MADKRTFIAIALPDTVKEQLGKIQSLLEPVSDGIKWIDPKLMHITLKFLGDTPEWLLDNVRSEFKRIVSNIKPFQLQLKGLGQFPKEGEPRILWAGMQKNPYIVYKLSDELNTAFIAMDFDDTGKRFSPHITLGRVKHKLHDDLISSYYDINLEENVFTIDKIIWYESCHRHGKLAYLPLEEYILKSK
ncbi:MAG: RNA 2',3'-cyclic phosphodiesterase [Candidatus Marinimicrobia bacterium]|nr:RNA 2',3'-cyclic phosphodiesterase [Candidatus Neomarinimicrobiota bacterium]